MMDAEAFWSELGALRRMGLRRVPSSRVADVRVRLKRRLRRAGVTVQHDISNRELIALVSLVNAVARSGFLPSALA